MEIALDYHFTLNSFKISQEKSDFSLKFLNFLRPPNLTRHYTASNKVLACASGADPRILGKKLK